MVNPEPAAGPTAAEPTPPKKEEDRAHEETLLQKAAAVRVSFYNASCSCCCDQWWLGGRASPKLIMLPARCFVCPTPLSTHTCPLMPAPHPTLFLTLLATHHHRRLCGRHWQAPSTHPQKSPPRTNAIGTSCSKRAPGSPTMSCRWVKVYAVIFPGLLLTHMPSARCQCT